MQITINDLRKTFGSKTAVSIDRFRVNRGDILGLVGNNGAGKTTLFRLILDLLKADTGTITLSLAATNAELDTHLSDTAPDTAEPEINPAESEDWKAHTGAYIDESFLIDFLTPEEYFSFIGKVNGLTTQQTTERISRFAPFMNGEVLNQKKLIRNFSAGNKQKVGIIAAMLNNPSILILDEPFNFLDPTSQNILKHLLTDFSRDTHATILISSHNLNHTVDISTRIALLESGAIIKDLPNTHKSAERELEEYFDITPDTEEINN